MNSEKERIAFVIGSMWNGGAERVISILANHYASIGYSVDIIMLLEDKCYYSLDKSIRLIPICSESKPRFLFLPMWIYKLRRYINSEKPSILVSFIARVNVVTILASLGKKIRLIVSERSNPNKDGRSRITKVATRLLYPRTDAIVFQTRAAQNCFPAKIASKGKIVPNPVSVKTQAAENSKRKIVSVGRLRPEKNHLLLIRAFEQLLQIEKDFELYIYGEGTYRDVLIEEIRKLGLSESVFLPGSKDAIHEEISDAQIFVLPSNHEGMSNALIEAMMMGLPCITTRYEGADEIITHGVNGILVDLDDVEAMLAALLELVRNKDIRQRLSLNGKKYANQMSLENILPKWEEIING